MGKFKMKFKVEKLEFEIEGEREVVPLVKDAMQQQFAGFLKPAEIVSQPAPKSIGAPIEVAAVGPAEPSRRKSQKAVARNGGGDTKRATALDFAHDPSNWGTPKQTFTTTQKAIWLSYVLEQQTGTTVMTIRTIIKTFNKHFRQAGELKDGSVYRDLGKAKQAAPPLVGEDTTKSPSEWYLTEAGKKAGVQLVDLARGSVVSAN